MFGFTAYLREQITAPSSLSKRADFTEKVLLGSPAASQLLRSQPQPRRVQKWAVLPSVKGWGAGLGTPAALQLKVMVARQRGEGRDCQTSELGRESPYQPEPARSQRRETRSLSYRKPVREQKEGLFVPIV